jgi:hypothetical protein
MTQAKNTMQRKQVEQQLYRCLSDKRWRLNNLYHITDKSARHIPFRPNWAQTHFYDNRHSLSLILKVRQLGFTTAEDIDILDDALFTPNLRCGIIAHHISDAQAIFSDKIKYAYDHLDDDIRAAIPLVKESADTLVFANGSSIRVSTSFRSGTLQRLHVSEFAKICAKYPHKAKEIITGAIQAVAKGQTITIESTAEGRTGYFYTMSKEAIDRELAGHGFGPLDFKLFFYSWWEHPQYVLSDAEIEQSAIVFSPKDIEYFESIEEQCKTTLNVNQRAWYIAKRRILGEDIKQEYPCTVEEAFEATIQGAYFTEQFRVIRQDGRITSVPVLAGVPVHTAWDLGMRDMTVVWFYQRAGLELRVIDYYEASGEGLAHYASVLDKKGKERGYHYGTHFGPHDIKVRELGTGKSRLEVAASYGIDFETVPRIENKSDAIEAARVMLPRCWFDDAHCGEGITRLENYRKEWNDRMGVYHNRPLHDINSNGADAFQTLSMAEIDSTHGAIPPAPKVERVGRWA